MANEQERTLAALQTAVQMEIRGKQYYRKASQTSSNKWGKKLLQTLAGEEDRHRRRFEEIYEALRVKNTWPNLTSPLKSSRQVKDLFARINRETDSSHRPPAAELSHVEKAMAMENETFDFYKGEGAKAASAVEKDFYESIAAEEKEHYLALLDYYEYLKNPAAWFVRSEHPALDGG
ncbi:MAG: ferritin family protein [Chloroflexota bacterium]